MVINELRKALDEGVRVGLLAPRVDENGDLQDAYTITTTRVAEVPASQRSQRIAPDVKFTAFLAGAIHMVKIRGVVTV